jgi:hypothetical protein
MGRKTNKSNSNSRFLHCGGKCAAFGRNDEGLSCGKEEQGNNGNAVQETN